MSYENSVVTNNILRVKLVKEWEELEDNAAYAERQRKSYAKEERAKADSLWQILQEKDNDEKMEEMYWEWYEKYY